MTDPDLPLRMMALPRDHRGFVIPWFVAPNADDPERPDFRVVRPNGVVAAHNRSLCWLCGQRLGRYRTFVIGPMCGVNRISSEPPSHRDCATYAAQVCPFLSQPKMRRSPRALPENSHTPAGFHIDRNPGCVALWTCVDYEIFRADKGGAGVLFHLGEPHSVSWYAESRKATRAEVEHSILTGMPLLREIASREPPGLKQALAHADLDRALEGLTPYLPAPPVHPEKENTDASSHGSGPRLSA